MSIVSVEDSARIPKVTVYQELGLLDFEQKWLQLHYLGYLTDEKQNCHFIEQFIIAQISPFFNWFFQKLRDFTKKLQVATINKSADKECRPK